MQALFTKLISEYGAKVDRICSAYERQPEKAQELYQDIWAEIWQSLPHFREIEIQKEGSREQQAPGTKLQIR